MRDYWRTTTAACQRPATVTFRQVVVVARPDSQAVAVARARADSLLAQLRQGADFATLANGSRTTR